MNLETRLPAELWQAIRVNYENRDFTASILDAFYFLSDLIRKKSGAEGDGSTLIGLALGGKSPKIKINRLQSESEINIQKGIETTLRGLYQAIRNPRSHEKISDTEEDAQAIIFFIGHIIRIIDKAKSKFSRQEFLRLVFDPNFVPQARYAKLLLAEVPVGQRLEVFIDVYRAKESGKPDHLKILFSELIPLLTDNDFKQACEVISDELMLADNDATIIFALGSLNYNTWPNISEAARLRTENRLISSIHDGRYNKVTDTCNGGALATWSTRYLAVFTLKKEFIQAISDSLGSNRSERENYVFKYFWHSLKSISEEMPTAIDFIFSVELTKGNSRFYNALKYGCPWEKASWTQLLQKSFEGFEAADGLAEDFDDDIPF